MSGAPAPGYISIHGRGGSDCESEPVMIAICSRQGNAANSLTESLLMLNSRH